MIFSYNFLEEVKEMSNKELADLIFPNIDKTIEDYEKMIRNNFLEE